MITEADAHGAAQEQGVSKPPAVKAAVATSSSLSSHDNAEGGSQGQVTIATSSGGSDEAQPAPNSADPSHRRPDSGQEATTDPDAYEAAHVHQVYEAIAPHFSATRHKPWPVVADFLLAQPPGSLGLDVGCGNGKYLPVNPRVHMLASDRSPNLVHLACEVAAKGSSAAAAAAAATAKSQVQGQTGTEPSPCCPYADLLVADGLDLPFRPAAADFAICIAVIHHMSTPQRRRDAIGAILRCTRRGGQVLLYVWALEQAASRRGWDERSDQDTLVPWVLRTKGRPHATAEAGSDPTYQRYYHLYREGELQDDVLAVGGTIVNAGYDRDNWWVICTRST
jgi:tRNA (uracil-5-)-methyltransferase TRM9